MRYYSAVVTDRDDPDQRGRIKAKIPALVDGEWHDWIDAWSPFGLASVFTPRVDDVVLIVASEGGAIRWLGGTVEGQRKWPEPYRKDYGKRSGIASTDGAACVVLVEGGGVIVLAGPQGTITLATTEDATTHPLVHGDTLGDAWDGLLDALTVFVGSTGAAVVEPTLGTASATLQTALADLKRSATFKSSKVSTE